MDWQAERLNEVKFRTLNNALYHTARRRNLEFLARGSNFLVIMLGTSSVFTVLDALNLGAAPWIGLAVAAVGAAQLVFDFSGRASVHANLQKQYYQLLGRIFECSEPTDAACNSFMAEILTITGEEPPTYRVVDAVAYNEALDALYGESRDGGRLEIKWYQSLVQHYYHFNNTEFLPRGAEGRKRAGG